MGPAPPATSGGGRRQLEAKHYILAALAATLISAAVVTIVSVVLSPARIGFAITKASSHVSDTGADGGVLLSLTIAANNTSGRAAVEYKSMFVDVSNNTGPGWEHWLRANLATDMMPLLLRPRNVTDIQASVPLVGGPFSNDLTGNKTSHSFSVLITAVARFKVGVAWTRLYDIKVSCCPVDFFANHSTTAACHAA